MVIGILKNAPFHDKEHLISHVKQNEKAVFNNGTDAIARGPIHDRYVKNSCKRWSHRSRALLMQLTAHRGINIKDPLMGQRDEFCFQIVFGKPHRL